MKTIVIDRRAFLGGVLAVTAASVASNSRIAVADALTDWLTQPFAPSGAMLDPQIVKELPADIAKRWGRFSTFLIKTWGFEPHVEPSVDDIVTDLFVFKTTSVPSYYSEYVAANDTVERARNSLTSEDRAFELLSFGVIEDTNPSVSRLGRFRKFVFSETARYLVSSGGFRRFKPAPGNAPAKNYQGYIAGPFNNPAYLPYRGLKS